MKYLKKILSSDQTRMADADTIQNEPIASIDLMERASQAFVREIEHYLKPNQKIAVVCGPGNNGGDGFAVTRMLQEKGFAVDAFLVSISDKLSNDCRVNMNRLREVKTISSSLPSFSEYDVLIDAIFGSGLTRPITSGIVLQVVLAMNHAQKTICSIDIPSGLFCDEVMKGGVAIRSDLTVSFQRPKLSFFFTESEAFLTNWKVVDIGLDEAFIQAQPSPWHILGEEVAHLVKPRSKFAHKGEYGRAILLAGSYGMMGAAVLASRACLRSGAGLLTAYVPKCGYEIVQTSLPEAMCLTDEHEAYLTVLPDVQAYDSVGIGPGLGKNHATIQVLHELFRSPNSSPVIDADALNLIAQDETLKNTIPNNSILTPHPLEFRRLVGDWEDSKERLLKQVAFSKKNQCVVVLKGAHTSISCPEGNVYFNTTGNPGMATAGSGDVLTGIITGLRAQGYSAIHAALIGVYFHGKAGDLAAERRGENALIASDLTHHLRIERTK